MLESEAHSNFYYKKPMWPTRALHGTAFHDPAWPCTFVFFLPTARPMSPFIYRTLFRQKRQPRVNNTTQETKQNDRKIDIQGEK